MYKLSILIAALAAIAFLSSGSSYAREWQRLGDRHVGFISDHDTIEVGRREGRFKRIKLLVRDNDIELDSVKIIFASGEVEDVVFHHKIRAGGESPSINLKTPWREGRFIQAIQLHYHSRLNFRGEAVVEVWGQED